MKTFPLRIGTPDGLLFEGDVVRVVCRTITGELAVLADHCNFCTALFTLTFTHPDRAKGAR